MKKALVMLMVAGMVWSIAPVAQAVTRATRCDVLTHRRDSGVIEGLEVCVSVNTHDFLGYDEGYVHVHKVPDYPLVQDDNVDVYVDSLKLFVDGDVKKQTNPDRWYTGIPFSHSTDWWALGGDHECQAKFDFKIRWYGDDVTNPIGVLSSGSVKC